jgi:hypothetical protein
MENSNTNLMKPLNKYWRPLMAWSYLVICLFDFLLAPMLIAISQDSASKMVEWNPLTLRGAGMYHMAMLAIVGITAWGRTQEKINMSPFGGVSMERETFQTKPTNNINNKRPRQVDDEFDFEDIPPTKNKQSRKT